jgi:beta-lactamase regulating signal transducer with metallopeptidase domain
MINYIIQVILFQTLFLAIYDFFLAKETFFTKNRLYLLITPVVSFLIPFVQLPVFEKVVSEDLRILLPEIILSPQSVIEKTPIVKDSVDYFSTLFLMGIVFFSILFIVKLIKIIKLTFDTQIELKGNYKIVQLSKIHGSFSFFNYIFLGKGMTFEKQKKVIEHELIHSKQRHSLDLLLFEMMKIVFWFNPLTYLFQKRITLVHEYITDSQVVNGKETTNYINEILSDFFEVNNISFINQLYKKSLIKKRIKMIMKTQSRKINQLKYLVLIPVLGSMLLYISCSNENRAKTTVVEDSKNKVEINDQEYSLELDKKRELIAYNNKSNVVEVKSSLLTGSGKKMNVNKDTLITQAKKTVPLDEIVLFTKIDEVPTYEGCPENDKECFNKNIQQHFARNFNGKLPSQLGLKPGKKRIIMFFKINKEGDITGIKVKAPHKGLEQEFTRVINLLPKMTPGKHNGKIVEVKYTLPVRIDVK